MLQVWKHKNIFFGVDGCLGTPYHMPLFLPYKKGMYIYIFIKK
jgi:hypothetical protein